MEQNNESGTFEIDDYTFWESPEKHALVRDRINNTHFFWYLYCRTYFINEAV